MEQAAYIILALFAVLAVKLWWENIEDLKDESYHLRTGLFDLDMGFSGDESDEDEEADPEFLGEVRAITSGRQLISFLYNLHDYDSLSDSENDEILRKALELNLDPEDWADIYHIAEPGSQLESVAESKAGDALE